MKPNQVVHIRANEDLKSKPIASLKILSVDGKKISGRILPPAAKPKKSKAKKQTPDQKTTSKEDASDESKSSKAESKSSKATEKTEIPTNSKAKPESEKKEDQANAKDAGKLANSNSEKQESQTKNADNKAKSKPITKPEVEDQKPVDLATGTHYWIAAIPNSTGDKKPSQEELVKKEVAEFSKAVTLGDWNAVKNYLGKLKDKEKADDVYEKILKALITAMPQYTAQQANQQKNQMRQRGETPPTSFLTPSDLIALSEAAPKPISVIVPKEDEKKEATSTTGAPTATVAGLPPGVVLPPGVSLPPGFSLPPGVPLPSGIQGQAATSPQTAGATPAETPAANEAAEKPKSKPDRHLSSFATLIGNAKTAGFDFGDFLKTIEEGTTHFGGDSPEKRLTAASLLMRSNMTEDVDSFLAKYETIDEQPETHRTILLRLWNQLATTRYSKKKNAEWLDRSWNVAQKILTHEQTSASDKTRALTRLIELSTIVDAEIGQQWLDDSFSKSPKRGMKVLANLGSQSSDMARKAAQTNESTRLKMLRMQNESVEKFLQFNKKIDDPMKPTLTLLAKNWITEAGISVEFTQQSSRSGYMSIDMYGNYYWANQNRYNGSSRRKRPIKIGDVLELVPSETWLSHVNPNLLTEIKRLKARLHLRINEEDKAFPYIESLASTHPKMAHELVEEFLKIWTQNHDPNTDRRQRNPYIYMYGFDQKAESIPLTRSKQERNLTELTEWIARIKKMPIEDVDEQLLANAFTTCHSQAEVYQLDKVRRVFGDLTKLKAKTIAELAQNMRTHLSTKWRQVKLQEANQTRRKLPEVQQEVLGGYRTAMAMVNEALAASPDDWKLNLAKACIMYDENAYQQSVKKSSEFSDKRDLAFLQFAKSADKYREAAPAMDKNKRSTDVYDRWFYAALGAVDLGQIKAENQQDKRQYKLIKEALDALPAEIATDHMGKFANNLFTRMSPIKPELKFRYLRGGFEIVGEHPRAWEAKSLYEYYQDLVHEIILDVKIDGDEQVGTEPFGLYVNIKHTPEIEREAGGFAKYVQNQNSMMYAFNYGRPTEDYRDKFRDNIDQAFEEHFEVVSVTFESADRMKSRPESKDYRVTPYAYVMLKAKGTEVDRVPSLQLDLDFLDTSGYVVIPVESPQLVVDCAADATERPIDDLKITQTLDERQSNEGKLIVEVSASGKGLIPNLDAIIELDDKDFEVVQVDDQGSLPTSFDEEGSDIQIVSDRSWTIEYHAKDSTRKANTFAFGKSKRENAEVKFQRYEDADLVAAEPTMTLEAEYGNARSAIWYWLAPLAAIGLIGVGIAVFVLQPKPEEQKKSFAVPQDVNPFTVLSLLKDIKHRNGISEQQAEELQSSINRIESYYFGDQNEDSPQDLESVAKTWVAKAK